MNMRFFLLIAIVWLPAQAMDMKDVAPTLARLGVLSLAADLYLAADSAGERLAGAVDEARVGCANEFRAFIALQDRMKADHFLTPDSITRIEYDFVDHLSAENAFHLASLLRYQKELVEQSARARASIECTLSSGVDVGCPMCGALMYLAARTSPKSAFIFPFFNRFCADYDRIVRLLREPLRGYLYPTCALMEAQYNELKTVLDATHAVIAHSSMPVLDARRSIFAAWYELYGERIDAFYNRLVARLRPSVRTMRLGEHVPTFPLQPIALAAECDADELSAREMAAEKARRELLAEYGHKTKHKKGRARNPGSCAQTGGAGAAEDSQTKEYDLVDRVAAKGLDDGDVAEQISEAEMAQWYDELRQRSGASKVADTVCETSPRPLPVGRRSPIDCGYAERVKLWHTDIRRALQEHHDDRKSKAQQFWAVAKHRIPFILESIYSQHAYTGVRKKTPTRADRINYFNGWISVFNGTLCLPGTFQITIGSDGDCYHRFFHVNKSRDAVSAPILDMTTAHEVAYSRRGINTVYRVLETDTCIGIVEKDDPYDVLYIIGKRQESDLR